MSNKCQINLENNHETTRQNVPYLAVGNYPDRPVQWHWDPGDRPSMAGSDSSTAVSWSGDHPCNQKIQQTARGCIVIETTIGAAAESLPPEDNLPVNDISRPAGFSEPASRAIEIKMAYSLADILERDGNATVTVGELRILWGPDWVTSLDKFLKEHKWSMYARTTSGKSVVPLEELNDLDRLEIRKADLLV